MFHLFNTLPLELRENIWLAAMPEPRLVRLEEKCTEEYNEEEYNHDRFSKLYDLPGVVDEIDQAVLHSSGQEWNEKEWDVMNICYARSSIPSLYKIDPGLEHFDNALRHNSGTQEGMIQTQLERFHFTSSHPKPKLPRHLLKDCSDIYQVWDATRRGYLWSRCPIPALLHTCKESRSTMQRAGYELAFRHRTSGPRTWFNFGHDILYLAHDLSDDSGAYPSESLDEGSWNIGQLLPDDLMRVQKLALGEVVAIADDGLSHAIRLFGNLKEVLLVKHHRPVEIEAQLKSDPALAAATDRWGHIETENDLWQALDYTVADIFSPRWKPLEARVLRYLKEYLNEHNGSEENFWAWMSSNQEKFLRWEMGDIMESGAPPWKIPKVRTVEIVTKAQAEEIFRYRAEDAARIPKRHSLL